MSDHKSHQSQTHMHEHGPYCGHRTVYHRGHQDYLHDGAMEHVSGETREQHSLEVDAKNPAACTPAHSCGAHAKDHQHGLGCGHEIVPHGDHLDYLVHGHLHHPCAEHCDDHGAVSTSAARA